MRPQALSDLRAAIEQNTERRSLEDLQAEGKKHVRVVSGEKVMTIIRAIVGDIIDREVGEHSAKDRERIAQESKQQFDRVFKLQAEQDEVIRDQRGIIAEHKKQLDELSRERQQLVKQLEEARSGERAASQAVAKLEERIDRSRTTIESFGAEFDAKDKALQDREDAIEELKRRVASQEQQITLFGAQLEEARNRESLAGSGLSEMEQRLGEAKATIENCNQEIQRLTLRLNEDDSLLEELKQALQAKELEAERLQGQVKTLEGQIELAREEADESASVADLRGEMAEMKALLAGMETRKPGADEETVSALMARLAEREEKTSADFDGRFSASLDQALDQITKTMEAATAKPIDIKVEATDVLVDKLFDTDVGDLSSNLDELEVESRASKTGIAANLARLKKMRQGAASGDEEKE